MSSVIPASGPFTVRINADLVPGRSTSLSVSYGHACALCVANGMHSFHVRFASRRSFAQPKATQSIVSVTSLRVVPRVATVLNSPPSRVRSASKQVTALLDAEEITQ